MMLGGGCRFIGVIGQMLGIIGLCLLQFTCILPSKSYLIPFPESCEAGADLCSILPALAFSLDM
jgi:hypothetical protein